MNELNRWCEMIKGSLENEEFAKITLSKPVGTVDLLNVYAKVILIKKEPMLSFTYHHKTNDIVKNVKFPEGIELLKSLLETQFKIGTLFTTKGDVTIRISKKGKIDIAHSKPSLIEVPERNHDKQKKKRAVIEDNYLQHLGITDATGIVIPRMADKFRQINKYLEVMEDLIKSTELPESIRIVDMGAGKGYLTFALYDYLRNKLHLDVVVTGVEIRKELVDKSNAIAKACGFECLSFECSSIEEFSPSQVDILIALHACDTATDDAIAKGIKSEASLIVCAPCCHKQIRQQLKGKEQTSAILKYGIFKEREFEMVTDTIRALILEKNHYKSNIFEFISNEHTRKNTMLVGIRSSKDNDGAAIEKQIDLLKQEYQIEYHYLEKLV